MAIAKPSGPSPAGPATSPRRSRAEKAADPVLDLAYLERQCFGDRALARDLLVLFDGQCRHLLPAITAEASPREQAEAAHALRGAAAAVGARPLAEALAALEARIEAGSTEITPDELGTAVSGRVAEARAAVAALLAS